MVIDRKVTGKAMTIPAGLLIGSFVSLGITMILAAVFAKLLDSEHLTQESIGYGVMGILLASSFGGAMVSYKRIKRQRLLVCMLSGVVYFGILLSITALFFGGQYEAVGVTGLLILCGCSIAVLTGMGEKRVGKRHKVKLPNR